MGPLHPFPSAGWDYCRLFGKNRLDSYSLQAMTRQYIWNHLRRRGHLGCSSLALFYKPGDLGLYELREVAIL